MSERSYSGRRSENVNRCQSPTEQRHFAAFMCDRCRDLVHAWLEIDNGIAHLECLRCGTRHSHPTEIPGVEFEQERQWRPRYRPA